MRNCPVQFYENCENAIIKCNSCGAGNGPAKNSTLYKPIEYTQELKDHPYLYKKNAIKSHQVKKALKEETVLANRIIKKTVGSGRVNGDGDFKLLGDIRMEHKKRFTSSSITVTKDEIEKGKRQGVEVWAITNQDKETFYVLTETMFINFLRLVELNNSKD